MAEPLYATPPPLPRTRTSSAYPAFWIIAATLALAYLTLLATRPDVIARYLPAAPASGTPEGNQGQRADSVAEVEDLRSRLETAQGEIASLKQTLASQSEQSQSLAERLLALEAKAPKESVAATAELPKVMTVADAASAAAAAAPAGVTVTTLGKSPPPAAAAPGKSGETEVAAAEPAPEAPVEAPSAGSGVKVINAPPPAPPAAKKGATLETGSVAARATDPIQFGPAVVKPSPKPVGIQIGQADTLDGLRLGWSLLADRHGGAALKNLEPRYTTGVDDNGLTYELLAGPVKTQADAKKLCKELEAKAVPCKVVDDFTGEAL